MTNKKSNKTINFSSPSPPLDIETGEVLKQQFTFQEFVDSFLTSMFNDGIIKEVDETTLQSYFANPEKSHEEIEKLAQYYYISNGDIFQLFDLTRVLPTLNYKILCDDKDKKYEKNLSICNKMLKKVKHKTFTREVITQLIVSGTVTGIWLGNKNNPYPFIFDNLEYAFPAYRKNGEWVIWVDLEWFDLMSETEREINLENLSPFVTESDYNKYKNNQEDTKYIELPVDRSICLRTHTLKRNQRLGIPWITQGLFSVLHKKKLKDLEKSIANKIINSIAVLTIGNKDNSNTKLNKTLKKKVYAGVRQGLEKNNEQGVTCIAIPDFCSLDFPEIKNGDTVLDPKKFESINDDISTAYGIAQALVNGKGSNFASAKLNLEIFYKRIGELLENIEYEVYQKLFNLILPKSAKDDFELLYDKEPSISTKDKIDFLMKLHSEGFAIKPIIDNLEGVSYEEYINQSIYEIEELKLREKITPPQLSYTTSGKESGRPLTDNPENEATNKSKTTDANNLPE